MREQSPTPTGNPAARGFTLIELLTSISIIAVLGAVAMPAIKNALEAAKMNAAMQAARQITLGLRGYADDSGGSYPSGSRDGALQSSNAAFRELEEYIDDERVYAVPGSAWGSEASNSKPYCDAGENHFAYISGLTTTSKSWFPLVVDGTDGSGRYGRLKGERGGLWQGRKGIVASVDGSVKTVRLQGEDNSRFLPRVDEPDEDALKVNSYMGSRARLLDPE